MLRPVLNDSAREVAANLMVHNKSCISSLLQVKVLGWIHEEYHMRTVEIDEVDTEQTVFIVDDDDAVRDALRMLVESVGLRVEEYPNATLFLEHYNDTPGLLVLDVRMPGMSGLELQDELAKQGITDLAILFISGHGDIAMAVEALKRGATDFLEKPFRDQDFIDRVHSTLAKNVSGIQRSHEVKEIKKRLETLTSRERQVMELVADGKANKVIAMDLDVSQRTVELHRAHVMEKMGVGSLAHLVRLLDKVLYNESS